MANELKVWNGNSYSYLNPKYADMRVEKMGYWYKLPTEYQINVLLENPMQYGEKFNPETGEVFDIKTGEVRLIIAETEQLKG